MTQDRDILAVGDIHWDRDIVAVGDTQDRDTPEFPRARSPRESLGKQQHFHSGYTNFPVLDKTSSQSWTEPLAKLDHRRNSVNISTFGSLLSFWAAGRRIWLAQ